MTYVIGSACIDNTDKACVEECPVDCIYEGDRKLYIHPQECIDCGACMVVCPVEAIQADRFLTADEEQFLPDSEAFFFQPLPGRATPLGTPKGAAKVGLIGVDTPLVQTYPRQP
jgi:ferredoxin